MDKIDTLSFKLELADLIDKYNTQLIIDEGQLLIDCRSHLELVAIEICNGKELRK